MKLKGWYIVAIVLTIFYFVAGIYYLVRMHIGAFHVMGYLLLINGIISLSGIISFTRKNYKAARTLFIISGILGIPPGILLIIFALLIDRLPDENWFWLRSCLVFSYNSIVLCVPKPMKSSLSRTLYRQCLLKLAGSLQIKSVHKWKTRRRSS